MPTIVIANRVTYTMLPHPDAREIPVLAVDFKYRLLFMFSTICAVGCVLLSLLRTIAAVKKKSEEWSASGNNAAVIRIGCRAVELLAALTFLAMDVLYLCLTYDESPKRSPLEEPAIQLTFLAIHMEPLCAQLVSAILLFQWFPLVFAKKWRVAAVFAVFNVGPYIFSLVLYITYSFLYTQWLSFTAVCLISLANVILFRFLLFFITSSYPTMAYNENNANVIQQKVFIIYLLTLLDMTIILLIMDQAFAMNMAISLFLTHFKLAISLGLSVKLELIARPCMSDLMALLNEQSNLVEPGLVRPRTTSKTIQRTRSQRTQPSRPELPDNRGPPQHAQHKLAPVEQSIDDLIPSPASALQQASVLSAPIKPPESGHHSFNNEPLLECDSEDFEGGQANASDLDPISPNREPAEILAEKVNSSSTSVTQLGRAVAQSLRSLSALPHRSGSGFIHLDDGNMEGKGKNRGTMIGDSTQEGELKGGV